MKGFVTTDRLRSFSDSVLLVGVVLLVYNLATLATSEPEYFEPDLFFHTLVAYICSFIVVFFYWSRFTLLLDYAENLEDVTVFVSLVFLVTVTLTPVALIGFIELGNEFSLIFSCIVQILAGILLITLVIIIKKQKTLGHKGRYYLIQVGVIPIVYAISLIISFIYYEIAVIIPIFILPIFLILRKSYEKRLKDV
jgi:uncharacterized membrane protein